MVFERMIRTIAVLFCMGFLGACQTQTQAITAEVESGEDAVAPPSLPAPSYDATVSQELLIPMADGIHLAATLTLPSHDGSTAAPGPFPVVVSVTPYSRNGVCGCLDRSMFALRGIAAVTVDTRGTGGSEGNLDENYFSPLEASDTFTVIEYFASQDYSSGKVGMAGGSYVGITQLLAAELRPPHLAVIVPQIPISDLYRDGFVHGGIMNLFFDAQYIGVQGGPGVAGGNNDPALLQTTVLGKLQQLTGTPIMFDYLQRPYDDEFYRQRSPIYDAADIEVPVMLMGGWRDGLSQRGNPELFHVLSQRSGVETRMVMDPCTHKGCGAPFAPLTNPAGLDDPAAVIFEFLDRHLRDADTPDRPPVRVYVQAAERYVDAQQWPPRHTTLNKLYLSQTLLSREPPQSNSQAEYFSNPAAGLSMSFDQYGTVAASPFIPMDQRLESGNGLTWRSAELVEGLTLIGPSQLHLIASSSATDTDWIVKLSDVASDGSETLITNGYLRASHRALDTERSRPGVPYHPHTASQAIEPGEKISYDIEIWPTAYELAPGHRLQLRLNSYDVPTHAPAIIQFDRTQPENTLIEAMPPAVNQVFEGGASYLLIPEYNAPIKSKNTNGLLE